MQERRNEHRKGLTYYLPAYGKGNSHLLGHVANVSEHGVLIVGRRPHERGSVYQLNIALPEQRSQSKHFIVEAICKWSQEDATSEFFRSGFKTARPVGDLASAEAGTWLSTISLKRLFDVWASFLGMLVASPLYLLVGLAIRLEANGPLFYSAERIGIYGRPFRMYKFRTMSVAAGDDGPAVTAHDDPRITRLGRFLRETKLNELPQLFNVLIGEMSFVGPRPEDAEFVAHYTPRQREVLSVKPGITSLATILYAGEAKMLSFSDVAETYLRSILPDKLRLDLLYVRNRSLLLDGDILVQTMLVLIPLFRRAAPEIEDILLGPIRKIRRYLSWFAIDAFFAFLAVGTAGLIWRTAGPLDIGIGRSLIAALIMTIAFSATNWVFGVQKVWWRYATAIDTVYVMLSVSFSTAIMLLVNALVEEPRFPPGMLLMASFFALAGFLGARYHRRLSAGLRNRVSRLTAAVDSGRERVLVVGAGESGQLTTWLLRIGAAARAIHVVGVVDDDLEKLGTLVHRVPVLGRCDRIPEVVRQHDIGSIVFSIDNIDERQRASILSLCRQTAARTVIIPNVVTFLREGISSAAKGPLDSGGVSDSAQATVQLRRSSTDLRHRIFGLAELARRGDFAGVTDGLVQLDEALRKVDRGRGAEAPLWWDLESEDKYSRSAIHKRRQQSEDLSEPLAGAESFGKSPQ